MEEPVVLKTYVSAEEAIADGVPADEAPYRVRGKVIVTCTWDDVPHLGEEEKGRMFNSYPAYQRDARSKGIPSLGSGSIYTIPETDIRIAPFELPRHYKRGYGMDVGWRVTAAAFVAWDPETDIRYLYDIHYREQAVVTIHAEAIRARGAWLPGRIDPAANQRAQADGESLMDSYREKGLNLSDADHSVEAGIQLVHDLLSVGKLKIFSSCGKFFEEYRVYRRNEKGAIEKSQDHLLDALRYAILSGVSWLESPPVETTGYRYGPSTAAGVGGWMGR